ncbi:hypothetical protein D0C36_24225, partial [Mucilaginibacter conchicola]
MKSIYVFWMYLLICLIPSLPLSAQPQRAKSVAGKLADHLSDLKGIRYHYARELSYPSENYFSKAEADCYYEFDQDTALRFQLASKDVLQVFDGRDYYSFAHQQRTYEEHTAPKATFFGGLSFFYNSIPVLRSTMQTVLKDDSVILSAGDTIINNRRYELLGLTMSGKQISYAGVYTYLSKPVTIFYKILIDRDTWLPHQVIQRNSSSPGDFTRVTFTAIETAPQAPAEKTWRLSGYQALYHIKGAEKK